MKAQQATPLAAYLQIIDFSLTALSQCRYCGDTIDAKTTCRYVVVGSNTEDCATRWWDHNDWTDGSCNASLLNQRCPTHGRISSYIPALKFVFFQLKQSPRHWRQMLPKKNFGFLLLCAKMHMKFERTRLLKDGKRRFEIEWNATSAESRSRRNLKMWPDCYGLMKLDMTRTQTTW